MKDPGIWVCLDEGPTQAAQTVERASVADTPLECGEASSSSNQVQTVPAPLTEAQTSAVEAGPSGSQSTPDTFQSDIEERCSPCDTYCFYYPDSSEEDDNASLKKG